MSTPKTILWEIEPHTKAKHEILRRYVGAWFGILGRKIPRILYLDGFCGPGRYIGGECGSPIIAIDQAISHAKNLSATEFVFFFIDKDKDRIEHLKFEISQKALPANIKTHPLHTDFESALDAMFAHVKGKGTQLAPTFAFVDPFGFSGIPFRLISQLLDNPRTEIFINIMADAINRFVEHPDSAIPQHIIDTFGTQQVVTLLKNSPDRFRALRDLYQSQLRSHAKFVRYFEMRDSNNRIIYYLFFASNNALGHQKIKEAFWKVDPFNGYSFSDQTDPNQGVLFIGDPSADVAKLLSTHFSNETVRGEQVYTFTNDKTAYIEKHARSALKSLEVDGKIHVATVKTDGMARKTGSFPPEVVISFA